MIVRAIKYPLRVARQQFLSWQTRQFVTKQVSQHALPIGTFDFASFKNKTIQFLNGLQTDESKVRYRYSASCTMPTLYASAYACMTYSLLNALDQFDETTRKNWVSYFNSFQDKDSGLFFDPVVANEHYNDSDWWGARHLILHMISAYTDLNARPAYPFKYLEPYYSTDFLSRWLRENEDKFKGKMDHDFDNKLMNIVCALQYQRDTWQDNHAEKAVAFIQDDLQKRINPATRMWGETELSDDDLRSRVVQFAYHLFPFYFYDNIYTFDFNTINKVVLNTQNKFGGYGVAPNSSACEDIDSIDILLRGSTQGESNRPEIDKSLQEAFRWIMVNQMADGGFVFRLNEKFVYGHTEMTGEKNQGAVFPTWFRTLSLAYLCAYFNLPTNFKITRCPGYEF